MVTAIRWMQKFVGRAESTLPFATSAYLHLTTDFFLSKWRTFVRKPVSWQLREVCNGELALSPAWVPEQRASVDGAEQVPGAVLALSMPFLLNLTSALGVLAPFHR